ncbi:glutaminyl-peptide cyclotransferase [uncultured Corynebacterium sp.]|uniref:glutaminyl-peptide cyclotransferase n=1 Tax=uncultured Corynebacterium sp. TaxID=159447 RepID=UPI0025D91025|nr:glutaminyl-peptide cyclotransferase [uncultured Corynebacterium sp.]
MKLRAQAVPAAVPAAVLACALLLTGCTGSPADESTPPDGPAVENTADSAAATQGTDAPATDAAAAVPRLNLEVVAEHPWDDRAFTQGLELDDDGSLLVGTGQYGESAIWRVRDWRAGSPAEDLRELPDDLFGEGITRAGDTVWQLTWKRGVAFARDAATLDEVRTVSYDGEGWGLCAQPDRLVMSDGTDVLTFRDPVTFDETGSVDVTAAGNPVDNLNELDCVDGPDGPEVWANRWTTNEIARIDPATGEVTGYVDATALVESLPAEARRKADVFNGIAHIPGTDRFLVTGKYWPTLFEVRISGTE